MIEQTITQHEARQIYDALGHDLDRAVRFEQHAKQHALHLLAPAPGAHILHAGVGTGSEHAMLHTAVGTHGLVVGYDLSRGMLSLTRKRAETPLCEGDVTQLPFTTGSFDMLFSAYLLDLIPSDTLARVLTEFRRAVRPGGRIALVTLTEGINLRSQAFIAGWKLLYRISPQRLGGCRPLQLSALLAASGFMVERHVIVQRGFPSEILIGS